VLGSKQVIFSSMKYSLCEDFQDEYDYAPWFLPAFVTPNDPVIRQAAALVNHGQPGTGEVSLKDQEARKFLRGLYDFMVGNKFKYLNTEVYKIDGQSGQTINYARDVLRDKAGNCVDLAVFYASVCENVGLKPKLFLVPGHCFPGVTLPGGGLIPVEITGVSARGADFDKAVEMGVKELEKWRKEKKCYEVDVRRWHDQGVGCLELPGLSASFTLKEWDIVQVEGSSSKVKAVDRKLAGTWRSNVYLMGNWYTSLQYEFAVGGDYKVKLIQWPGGMERVMRTVSGSYDYKGKVLNLRPRPLGFAKIEVLWQNKDQIKLEWQDSSNRLERGFVLTFRRQD
jgi:hypothetical protein